MAQSGASLGAETVIAKAHHGSVSKEQRALIEDDLKRGRLPAVVATSSLELGIDMGAVDLVVQIESPPSVASALQRVGRAGHQVGEVSRGVLYPKHRGDLAQTAVAVQRMRTGAIESLRVPTNPLDVLAQQVVAPRSRSTPGRSTTSTTWSAGPRRSPSCRARRTTRRSTCSAAATPPTSSPSSGPRIVWDRVTGDAHRPAGRPAAGGDQRRHHPRPRPVRRLPGRRQGTGRRVGELDEEMVYESRVGDIFALGATSWRIEDITHDRVLVTPGARHPGPAAVLEGRHPGPPGRARPGHRRVHPRARRAAAQEGRGARPASTASTRGPPATSSPTSTSSSRPPTCCPATAPCSSSGSATSSATGGWCCTRPTAPRCTRPGRWRSTPGCASATASTARRSPPTTAS